MFKFSNVQQERTILDEVPHFRDDLIEHQLGHAVKDWNGRAYIRTSFLTERTAMMQGWSDYLNELKSIISEAIRSERMTTAEARARLHDLIESLPTADVPTALRLLEALNQVPPALRDVPIDDEPETEEERAAVAEARRELDEGKGNPPR